MWGEGGGWEVGRHSVNLEDPVDCLHYLQITSRWTTGSVFVFY